MTELEMTKLCALAMGITGVVSKDRDYEGVPLHPRANEFFQIEKYPGDGNGGAYEPLIDDAQAMALVKKFRLTVTWHSGINLNAICYDHQGNNRTQAAQLNRAIVECVAKSQQSSGDAHDS